MKKLCFFILWTIVINCTAFCQQKNALSGTWYQKKTGYEFRQDGTAQVFGKTVVKNYSRKLTINENGSYTYIEIRGADSVTFKGKVSRQPDLLVFTLQSTDNANIAVPATDVYPLFFVDKDQLIYAMFPLENKEIKNQEDPVFRRVEEEAVYKPGKLLFYKALYNTLSSHIPESTDTVFLYSFEMRIDEKGIPDINSIKQTSGNMDLLAEMKSAIGGLPQPFVPAQQNGRSVAALFRFNINY